MSGERRAIVTGVVKVWATLVLLSAASLAYALGPGLPSKLLAALAIVIVQAALVLGGFMGFRQSSALVQMAALIGAVWLSFLFLMTFADLLTR